MREAGDMRNIAVIGGGYVGRGVALQFAWADFRVLTYNRSAESAARARAEIGKSLDALVRADMLGEEDAREILGRIAFTRDFREAVAGGDFVVEAVAENLDLKREVFGKMDEIAPPDVILASETSGLGMTEISRRTKRPERCIVTHNYTPPHLIPVVEVSPGRRTSAETTRVTRELLERAGKKPVLCREVPGHIGVRLTTALRREAFHIVEKGYATPEDVDAVWRSLSPLFPALGVCMLSDFSGLDVLRDAHRRVQPSLDARAEPAPLMDEMVEKNLLGVKSGEGFYRWSAESAQEAAGARDAELIRRLRRSDGLKEEQGARENPCAFTGGSEHGGLRSGR